MNLAETLDNITAFINKYTVLPTEHAAPTISLWVAHTWTSTAFYTSPRLVFSSPVPGSGKTRNLELLDILCHHPKLTISSSTAALFRRIGKAHQDDQTPPTILFDETDALFGNARPSEQTEQLRSLMNSGYKRGATIDRCEGDAADMKVIEWPVFSPLALAGLAGKLPDTIVTRAIVVEMRKRAPGEKVAPFRERAARAEAENMVAALRQWAPDALGTLSSAQPVMPSGVEDRPAEVWEPLLAIADMAGGHWPDTARAACTYFVHAPKLKTPSLGIELLSDVREVMGHGIDTEYQTVDRIRTTDLLQKLKGRDESPWAEIDGRGLTPRRLSQFMAGYSVAPVQYKEYGKNGKGYTVSGNASQVGLADAWNRYLPPVPGTQAATPSQKSVTPVTAVTPQVEGGENGNPPEKVTATQSVTPPDEVTENMPLTSAVTAVSQVTDFAERVGGNGPGNADLDALILDLLSPAHPQGMGKIMRHVKDVGHPGADVPDVLARLASAGLVTEHPGMKFTRKESA